MFWTLIINNIWVNNNFNVKNEEIEKLFSYQFNFLEIPNFFLGGQKNNFVILLYKKKILTILYIPILLCHVFLKYTSM